MVTVDELIREAREWVGTPFVHQGRRKGVGCDCAGLCQGVAKNKGIEVDDIFGYSRYPNPKMLLSHLNTVLIAIEKSDMRPGDVVIFTVKGVPQHMGLLTDKGIIHADETKDKVVEHAVGDRMRSKIYKVYRIPGVE